MTGHADGLRDGRHAVTCHPNGTWGWDGQLGSCSLGGMGWDVPDCPMPSQWDLGMGWTAGIMLSGWDGMGRPRQPP